MNSPFFYNVSSSFHVLAIKLKKKPANLKKLVDMSYCQETQEPQGLYDFPEMK